MNPDEKKCVVKSNESVKSKLSHPPPPPQAFDTFANQSLARGGKFNLM